MSCELGAGRGLPRTLQTNKHDNIWFAFLWLEGLGVRVHEGYELVEDSFLYEALFIGVWRKAGEVDLCFDRLSEVANEFDVDVGGEERRAYLLDHVIESLEDSQYCSINLGSWGTGLLIEIG